MTTLLKIFRSTYIDNDQHSMYTRLKDYRYRYGQDDYQLQCVIGYEDDNTEWWNYVHELARVFHAKLRDQRTITGKEIHGHKLQSDINTIINRCEDDLVQCEDCSDVVTDDESIYIEDGGHRVCNSCCERDYVWHDGHDMYYFHENYPNEDDDWDDDSYQTGVRPYDFDVTQILSPIYHGNEKRLMSTEVEFERNNNCDDDIAVQINDALRGFALCKHDGSLQNGFEVVTAPATISALKEGWTKFSKHNFTNQITSWNTTTCGMHVHVDRTSVTPLDIGKLLVFINGRNNRSFVENIAGRSSAQWSQFKYKNVKDSLHRSDKYEALATHKPKTIEFRLFKGNGSKIGYFRNIEFVDALCNFVRTVGLDKDTDSVNSLSYTNFVKYMDKSERRGQYPYFFSWLVRKGYTKGKGKNIQNESEES